MMRATLTALIVLLTACAWGQEAQPGPEAEVESTGAASAIAMESSATGDAADMESTDAAGPGVDFVPVAWIDSTAARVDSTGPVFHIQLWDAQKTNWAGDALEDIAANGFTVVQNGWNKSLFPSRSTLDNVARHGLLYGAYIDTRYMFGQEATPAEKDKAQYVVGADGKKSKSEVNTFDPVYQAVVRRGMEKGFRNMKGSRLPYKIMLNSEHTAPLSYDDLTKAEAVRAGVMTEAQKIPTYNRGVSSTPAGEDHANPYRFLLWFAENGGDPLINRVAAEAARTADPAIRATTDPINDGYAYGQYRDLDILEDWVRVHQAPRDPLSMAYRVERLKAHIRHDAATWPQSRGARQIWIGPQLGSTGKDKGYAAPADELQEAMWLAVAFGARGLTFWGYDSIRRSEPLDMDTWHRVGAFRKALLSLECAGLVDAKDAPRACAVLLSKANQVYSNDIYYRTDDNYEHFCRVALTAHVPFDVLYDEDVFGGRLSGYKAVLLPGLDHLTPELEGAIAAFAKAGGRVVRWPALNPTYTDYEITKGNVNEKVDAGRWSGASLLPHQYRAWREEQADKLSGQLADIMDVRVDKARVILNVVIIGGRRYAVLVNDNRTYGEWTKERGYRWAEDKGEATEAVVTVGRGENEKTYKVKIAPAGAVIIGL